jgi:hypothetical protein
LVAHLCLKVAAVAAVVLLAVLVGQVLAVLVGQTQTVQRQRLTRAAAVAAVEVQQPLAVLVVQEYCM